eukprot:maker-scaffold_9-snap-gene-4.3-mRNA-1 protein AED:0.10 eAED:0.12 QI:0/0.5/0.6/1/1/1/5/223/364
MERFVLPRYQKPNLYNLLQVKDITPLFIELDDREVRALQEQYRGNYQTARAIYESLVRDITVSTPPNISHHLHESLLIEDPNFHGDNRDVRNTLIYRFVQETKIRSIVNIVLDSLALSFCIIAIIAVIQGLPDGEACNLNALFSMLILYTPMSLFVVIYSALVIRRLFQIKFDWTTITSKESVFPEGSRLRKLDKMYSVVSRFKTFWWFVAFILLAQGSVNGPRCRDFTSEGFEFRFFPAYIYIFMISNFDFWMTLFLILLLVLLILLYFSILAVRFVYNKIRPSSLNQKSLNKLSVVRVDTELGLASETCNICLEDFEKDDQIRILPCQGGHKFHQVCIDGWLTKKGTCPTCREPLKKKRARR